MKKQVALLLSVCATLSSVSMLTACGGGHEHSYEAAWTKDETHHWHACEGKNCNEVSEKAEHVWNDGVSAETAGEKLYTCTVCEQTKTAAVKTTVTEEEWNALLLLDNFTIDGIVTERGLQETMDYLITETAIFSENTEPDGDYYSTWTVKKDDGWYMSNTYEKGGEYSEGMFIDGFFCNIYYFVRVFARAEEGTNFKNLTYDETKKAYVFNDTTFYIEDGKLVKLEWCEDGAEVTHWFIFSNYGTTVANPPENLK